MAAVFTGLVAAKLFLTRSKLGEIESNSPLHQDKGWPLIEKGLRLTVVDISSAVKMLFPALAVVL